MKKNKLSYKLNIQLSKVATCVLSFCVAGLLIFHILVLQTGIANSKTVSQKLTLDLSHVAPVKSVVGVDTDFFLSPEDVNHKDVWTAVADIGIPVLRFPGGQGNWYDWRTGTINTAGETTFDFMQQNQSIAVPMDTFMNHAHNVGASVSYVINLVDSPESIQELASYWNQTNAPVQWVEIGNEPYLFSEAIGGPVTYLERARKALKALRTGGYQGPVGIAVAALDAPGAPHFEFRRQWNEAIAAADIQDFDAIVLHYYPWVQDVGFYTDYEKGPPVLIKTIKTLREQFPGKQVWVTEWNLGPPIDIPEFNSLVHALFDLRMLHAMLDSRVLMSCYHVLTGTGWELLGPDRLTLEYSKGIKMLRRVPFFAFKELLKAQGNGVYLEKQAELNGLEYMAFLHDHEVRIVAWTPNSISTSIDLEIPGFKMKFTDGEALYGQFLDNNGSLLSKDTDHPIWSEKIVPTTIDTPVINGPGITFLRFSEVP